MAFERREYKGAAPQTTLSAPISDSDTTIGVVDGTGYPTGAVGPFFLVIDAGTVNEEKVFCVSRSDGSFIVTGGRGADDTLAVAHAAGATVDHVFTAYDADEANSHITDTTKDHHTQYLNTTRHKAEAHSFGTGEVLGTPGTPTSVGTSNAAGSGSHPAREDHTHKIGTGAINVATMIAAGTITATQIATGAISSSLLATGSVTAGKIAVGGVSASNQFAAGVVDTAAIAANAVTAAKLANNTVTAAQIANGTITSTQLASNAVATANVADGAVTNAKAGFVFTSFTPTVSGWTLGNGSATGRYMVIGKLFFLTAVITAGSTTAFANNPTIALPGAISPASIDEVNGVAKLLDSSAGAVHNAFVRGSGSALLIKLTGTQGNDNLLTTTPFTWANGDEIHVSVWGELA